MSIWSEDEETRLQEQQLWLSEDSEKIVICDIEYHDGISRKTGHFSNYPYIMPLNDSFLDFPESDGSQNTLQNIAYEDNIISIPNIISRIDSNVNIGAIEFLNADGAFDHYIDYAWEGHPLKIYIGAKDWIKGDFILILEAVSSVISSPRNNVLSLGIRDKKEVFNVKAQTQLITEEYIESLYASTAPAPAFSKPVENILNAVIGVEIRIKHDTSGADIIDATRLAIDNISFFNAVLNTGNIDITQELSGDYWAIHDGSTHPDPTNPNIPPTGRDVSYDTEMSFSNTSDMGPITSHPTTQTIGLNSRTPDLLNSKCFKLYSTYRSYYFWYNVEDANGVFTGIDPELLDSLTQAFVPSVINIPESILNTPVPICLGKCFNVTPKLIDAANHVYQVHEGEVSSIGNIRANGVPLAGENNNGYKVQYELNESIGCFRLLVSGNTAQITCDVEGPKDRPTDHFLGNIEPYSAPHLIEWLAVNKTSLTNSDLCVDTFTNISDTVPYPLGLYIADEVEVSNLITEIMSSIGGYARFNRLCSLQLLILLAPENEAPDLTIDDDLIVEKGLSLSLTETPKKSISLGYDRNWTVQDRAGLADYIDEEQEVLAELYSRQESTVVANNDGVLEMFPLAQDNDLISTLISDFPVSEDRTYNAEIEVQRRVELRNKKRFIYKIESTVAPFTLGLGDVITIKHRRYGFEFGKKALIIGMDEKPTLQRVDLEVWL